MFPRVISTLSQQYRALSSASGRVITGRLTALVGSKCEMSHTYSQAEVSQFANLSGDNNRIHIDAEYASKTPFGKPIVHGIFTSSLFSTILGSTITGAVYVSQSLQFLKPVFVDSTVLAKIEVLHVEKRKRGNLLTCSSTVDIVLEEGELVRTVTGEAKVLIPFE